MESKKNTAIVLDEKGCFRKVKVKGQNLKVGEQISLNQFSTSRGDNYFKSLKVVAALMVIAILTTVPIYYNNQFDAYAYISIDINPSLELTINSRGKVLRVSALNDDANNLLTGLMLKQKTVEEAVLMITDKAQSLGYIEEDNNDVFITSVVKNSKIKDTVTQEIVKAVEKNEENQSSKAVISVLEAQIEERSEAKDNNISVGKYLTMKKLQEKDIEITLEDVKNKGIGEIIKEKGSEAKDIILEKKPDAFKDKIDEINDKDKDKDQDKDKDRDQDKNKDKKQEDLKNKPVDNKEPKKDKPVDDEDEIKPKDKDNNKRNSNENNQVVTAAVNKNFEPEKQPNRGKQIVVNFLNRIQSGKRTNSQ